MRILFTRFPLESADGGAENQTQWLMEGLKARGYKLSFLGSCPVILRRSQEAGIRSAELRIGDPPVTKTGAISFLWRKAAMKRALLQAIQNLSEKPDVVFMLSLSEKLLITEWMTEQGIRVFWIEHDRIGPWLQWNPWLRTLKKASQHAKIICVSEVSRKLYRKMGFDPTRVIAIPNGVPPSSPVPSSHALSRPPGLHVGTVARLDPEKGIDVLIHSIAELPEITLSILGKGREEAYIRTLIEEDTKRMGHARIHLLSHVDDLSVFYRSLDIFVLPSSDHDPFGLVAAEAMECGTATIVTDACGISGSIKTPEEALVVPAGSPRELAAALRSLFDPERRRELGRRGSQAVMTRLTIPVMVAQYEKLLSGKHSDEHRPA